MNFRNLSAHARNERVSRLVEAGMSDEQITRLLSIADKLAGSVRTSAAIRLAKLSNQVGQAWGEKSNGNQVWAIMRQGRCVTFMLRRETQPSTPEAMGVERVYMMKEGE